MDDGAIIDLYWKRSERAVTETKNKYGRLCRGIAMRILRNMEDAEECEQDTYLRAWNSIPPKRPDILSAYLGRIARNLSLDRYDREHAEKRGKSQIPLVLEELEECIPDENAREISDMELREVLNQALASLTEEARGMFGRRYFLGSSIREIAEELGFKESRVKMSLLRSRNSLRKVLEREGVTV
jgi:RNA polymerase sigma-70 factor (ECF subfamily)